MEQSVIPDETWAIHQKPHEQRRYDWMASRPPVQRALDAGCHLGYMTTAIRAQEVVAIDIHPYHVQRAEWFWEENGLTHITAQQADVLKLPFDDDAFDAVFCCEVLEHLRDPHVAAAELERVCRGVIYASVPANGHLRAVPGHRQDFTPETFTALFSWPLTVHVEEPHMFGEATCG